MRKTIPVTLLILSLLLSACQAIAPTPQAASTSTPKPTVPPADTPTPTPTTPPQLLVTPDQLDGITVDFWHPWAGDRARLVNDLVNQFNQTNAWGITIRVTAFNSMGMMTEAVDAAIEDGEVPALVAAPSDVLADWSVNHGLVVNLNDFLNQNNGQGFSATEISDFYPSFWQQDATDTIRLGIPARGTAALIVYNQSWAEELGAPDAPTTFDDFETAVCAAAQHNNNDYPVENDGTGGWIINTSPVAIWSWLRAYNAETISSSTGTDYDFTATPYADAFSYIRALSDNGCAWFARNSSPYDYFSSRYALAYAGWVDDILAQETSLKFRTNEDRWNVFPYPGQNGSVPLVTTGESYGILQAAPEAQYAAWLFIHWISQADQQARIIKADSSLPLNRATTAKLSVFASDHPQWAQTLNWLETATPAPAPAWWRTGKNVLQDAFWQSMQVGYTIDQIPTILEQIQPILQDALENQP